MTQSHNHPATAFAGSGGPKRGLTGRLLPCRVAVQGVGELGSWALALLSSRPLPCWPNRVLNRGGGVGGSPPRGIVKGAVDMAGCRKELLRLKAGVEGGAEEGEFNWLELC